MGKSSRDTLYIHIYYIFTLYLHYTFTLVMTNVLHGVMYMQYIGTYARYSILLFIIINSINKQYSILM